MPDDTPARTESVEQAEATPEVPVPEKAPAAGRWTRFGGRDLLELFVLTGFALAQPLLSETGKAPELFTYRRVNSMSMVWLLSIWTASSSSGSISTYLPLRSS